MKVLDEDYLCEMTHAFDFYEMHSVVASAYVSYTKTCFIQAMRKPVIYPS